MSATIFVKGIVTARPKRMRNGVQLRVNATPEWVLKKSEKEQANKRLFFTLLAFGDIAEAVEESIIPGAKIIAAGRASQWHDRDADPTTPPETRIILSAPPHVCSQDDEQEPQPDTTVTPTPHPSPVPPSPASASNEWADAANPPM